MEKETLKKIKARDKKPEKIYNSREYIYRHFLSLSIYLSSSYSFYFLLDSIIPSRFKYLDVFNLKINLFILIVSLVYAKVIETLSEKILSKKDEQYLFYSLAKFFINTFINSILIFLLVLIVSLRGLQINAQAGLPILSLLFFPFLLYAGFFFNFATSFFVFATKEDYAKKNPSIKPFAILFTRAICSIIYIVSFVPFVLISLYFLSSLRL